MGKKMNLFNMFMKKVKIVLASIAGSVFLNSSSVKHSKVTSSDYDMVINKQGKKVFESPITETNTEFILELEDEKIIINITIHTEKKEKISKIKRRELGTPRKLGGSMSELEVKRQGRLLASYINDLKLKNGFLPSPIEKSFSSILKEEPEIFILEKLNTKTQEKKEGNPILNSESELKKE